MVLSSDDSEIRTVRDPVHSNDTRFHKVNGSKQIDPSQTCYLNVRGRAPSHTVGTVTLSKFDHHWSKQFN